MTWKQSNKEHIDWTSKCDEETLSKFKFIANDPEKEVKLMDFEGTREVGLAMQDWC